MITAIIAGWFIVSMIIVAYFSRRKVSTSNNTPRRTIPHLRLHRYVLVALSITAIGYIIAAISGALDPFDQGRADMLWSSSALALAVLTSLASLVTLSLHAIMTSASGKVGPWITIPIAVFVWIFTLGLVGYVMYLTFLFYGP